MNQTIEQAGPMFPWPAWVPPEDEREPQTGSSWGLSVAMSWKGLTLEERAVALFIGEGAGGPGNETYLADRLEVPVDKLVDILWTLNRKGFLQVMAGWWSA